MSNNKYKKRYTLILLLVLIIFSISYLALKESKSYDINKVFKSERAFGNDYFDIYEFTAKEEEKISGNKIDDDYFRKARSFKQLMLIHESDIDNYKDLSGSIDSLEKRPDTIYSFKEDFNKPGHSVLYIYNSKLNKGYIFDFQI